MGLRKAIRAVVAVLAMVCGVALADEIPWGEDRPAPQNLPAVFRGRGADRLAAEEVARMDGYRKLIERIYGLQLDAQTDVYDLVLESKVIKASVANCLKGMKDVGIKYYNDGRVELAVKVTIRDVVESIQKDYKRVERGGRLVSEDTLEKVKRENRDKEIVVVGRGALRGSKGLEKIRAMRAAELGCYERIAARVLGIRIKGDTTFRDFFLEQDRIRAKVSGAFLSGVKFTKYVFYDDGTCAATGQITIREVVEIVTRAYRRYAKGGRITIEDIKKVERKNRDLVIVETSKGVVRTAPAPKPIEPWEEQKTVFERVLRSERVIRREIGVE